MFNKKLKYTVVGLGSTGVSCVDFLKKNNCAVSVVDTRIEPPNLLDFKNKFKDVPLTLGVLELPADTEIVVISPGVSLHSSAILAAKNKGIPVIGDIELFAQVVNVPIIAITGSNGKSTVVTLVSKMIEASGIAVGLGGNIGVPALSLLEGNYEFYVLELSSFQLETTYSLRATAATILNVSPDHLDRHGSLTDYHAAKLRIYNNATKIIVNREDAYTLPESSLRAQQTPWCWQRTNPGNSVVDCFVANAPCNDEVCSFGLDVPKDGQYGLITDATGALHLAKGQEKLLPVAELKLIGQQNVLNALAALALADAIDLPIASCLSVLKTFAGLPHRCELLGKFADVLWINDSKGTNVGATVAAINGVAKQIPGKLVIILGGISKGADLSPLLPPVLEYCKAVIVIGEAKEAFKALFAGKIPCYEASSMQQCVAIAVQKVVPGDGVLLSPACSSLDMFANFQARGLAFQQELFQMMEFA